MTNENKSQETAKAAEPAQNKAASDKNPSKAQTKPAEAAKAKPAAPGKQDTSTSTKPPTHHPRKTKHHGSGVAYFLILLVAVGTGGGAYWLWQQQTAIQQSLAQMEQQASEQQASLRQQIADNNRNQQNSLAQFQQQQQDLDNSLKNLYSRLGSTTRDWVIAEADYLLQIANDRLQLAHDVKTAIAALKLADQRIRTLSEPSLLRARNSIAKEITQLETMNVPDVSGIAMQLNGIVEQIESLPLRVRSTTEVQQEVAQSDTQNIEQASTWRSLLAAVWQALKSLVTVRHNEKPAEPLLTPDEVGYLKQNVKLKIEQAQLALLQQQQNLYQQDLNIAANWLDKYFDTDNAQVENTKTLLLDLSKKPVEMQIPDISESKRVLNDIAKRINLKLPLPEADKQEAAKQ